MAVDVKIDTPQRIRLEAMSASLTYLNTFGTVLMKKQRTSSGCAIRPTQRSVIARHRNNSFVGGWTEDTLRRAIRIRPLPRHAVMERKMFKAAQKVATPANKVLCCLTVLVKFL